MQKNPKVCAAAFATLLLVILAMNLVSAAIATPQSVVNAKQAEIAATAKTPTQPLTADNLNPTTPSTPTSIEPERTQTREQAQIQKLKEEIPKTLEEAQAILPSSRTRYLMYTFDGLHIMWGVLGNGHFIGTDNQGKTCWGIYGQGIFAGFYDGQFFWGKYSNVGTWKAEYLFGLRVSEGKYIIFPSPLTSTTDAVP